MKDLGEGVSAVGLVGLGPEEAKELVPCDEPIGSGDDQVGENCNPLGSGEDREKFLAFGAFIALPFLDRSRPGSISRRALIVLAGLVAAAWLFFTWYGAKVA